VDRQSASAISELSSWALDYQRLQHADLRILADTSIAIPMRPSSSRPG